MNEEKIPQYNETRTMPKKKKKILIVLAAAVGVFVLCGVLIAVLENAGNGRNKGQEVETVDPWLLDETKPEDFDIMEYEEYLMLDRTVYRYDKNTGVTVSVNDNECDLYGEEFELVYYVIQSIIAGDHRTYNSYMGDGDLKKQAFTQQQIYDIEISQYSKQSLSDKKNGEYTEYVFEVKYKIHENNGTYRNTIQSDVSRPVYFVINDSSGDMLVMDMIEKVTSK